MATKHRIEANSEKRKRLFREASRAWDRRDMKRAFRLFMQSAKLGDAGSQIDLGYFFDNGLSVKMDKIKALEWYRRAYRQGSASGANNIATVYRELGETQRMLWWFRRAAAMGDIDVLLQLGKRYEEGQDVPRNPVKAKKFYRRVLASRHATKDDRAIAEARLTALSEHQPDRRKSGAEKRGADHQQP